MNRVCLLFKHSTRCIISERVLDRFEKKWEGDKTNHNISFFFLDLIAFRGLSNEIASLFQVKHESPQVLVIHKKKCIYHTSHADILDLELSRQIATVLEDDKTS